METTDVHLSPVSDRVHYRIQTIDDVYGGGGGNRYLFWESHDKHSNTVWQKTEFLHVTAGGTYSHHFTLLGTVQLAILEISWL
jgi:hypothetical protein